MKYKELIGLQNVIANSAESMKNIIMEYFGDCLNEYIPCNIKYDAHIKRLCIDVYSNRKVSNYELIKKGEELGLEYRHKLYPTGLRFTLKEIEEEEDYL